MNLKGTLIALMLLLVHFSSRAQFKNIKLDEQSSGIHLADPAIAVNPRYPNNIVGGSAPDNFYFSKDGGKSWNKGKLSSSVGLLADPAIITDDKGNFFYFHLTDPTGGLGGDESEKADRIVLHRSDNGGETWSPGEPVVLTDPKDQQRPSATTDGRGNLFLTWTQFDKYGDVDTGCKSNVLFSMSKNGKKWSEQVVISQSSGPCVRQDQTPFGGMPAVTFDGKVVVAWASHEKIFVDRSFNGGEWWLSNDIVVGDQPGGWQFTIPGHGESNGLPVLITDLSKSQFRGSLYLVWADQRNGEDDTDIWFTRSHNYGDNWSLPMRVNNDGKGKHQYLPWMTVDQATGYLYIVYYDRRNHADNQTDVYLAYSADGGASFKNVLISETPFAPREDRPFSRRNSISAHKGVIVPVWARMDEGNTSLWTTIIRHEDLVK